MCLWCIETSSKSSIIFGLKSSTISSFHNHLDWTFFPSLLIAYFTQNWWKRIEIRMQFQSILFSLCLLIFFIKSASFSALWDPKKICMINTIKWIKWIFSVSSDIDSLTSSRMKIFIFSFVSFWCAPNFIF